MNELEKAVAELLTKATSAAEAAGQFVVEQLPDIAQQYVIYKGASSVAWVVAWASVVVIFFWLLPSIKRWAKDENAEEMIVVYAMFGGGAAFGAAILSIHYLQDAMLAFLAPKVLLLQWAASLVK